MPRTRIGDVTERTDFVVKMKFQAPAINFCIFDTSGAANRGLRALVGPVPSCCNLSVPISLPSSIHSSRWGADR